LKGENNQASQYGMLKGRPMKQVDEVIGDTLTESIDDIVMNGNAPNIN